MHIAGSDLVQVAQDTGDYVFGSKDPDNKYSPFQWNTTLLPRGKNLANLDSGMQDQGSYGSCVGNAQAKVDEMILVQHGISLELSRMFIYYNARKRYADMTNTPVTDSGSSIFLSLAEQTKKGVATEAIAPYINVNTAPSADAYQDGLTRLVGRYERLGVQSYNLFSGESVNRDIVLDTKVAIANNMPVVFGMRLLGSFFNVYGPLSTQKTQYNPTSPITEYTPGYVGAHCITIVGYDDDLGGVIFENSWGSGWGDNGFGFLSYEAYRAQFFDAFAVRNFMGYDYIIPENFYIWDAKQRVVSWDVNGIPGQVYRLYQTAFTRRPDWDGLGYWIWAAGQGLTQEQIANSFIGTAEFQYRYGNTDNRTFVKLMYENALYREPDQAGWDYWTNVLDNSWATRGQVMISLSESQENKDNCAVYMSQGIMYFPYP